MVMLDIQTKRTEASPHSQDYSGLFDLSLIHHSHGMLQWQIEPIYKPTQEDQKAGVCNHCGAWFNDQVGSHHIFLRGPCGKIPDPASFEDETEAERFERYLNIEHLIRQNSHHEKRMMNFRLGDAVERIAELERQLGSVNQRGDADLQETKRQLQIAQLRGRRFVVDGVTHLLKEGRETSYALDHLAHVEKLGEAGRRDLLIRFRDWMARWPLRDANLHIEGDAIICTCTDAASWSQINGTWRNHITALMVERV